MTISLLCDGYPNGGVYRSSDVRPLLEEARAWGVRFRWRGSPHAVIGPPCTSWATAGADPRGAGCCWHDEGPADEGSIHSSFDLLSRW